MDIAWTHTHTHTRTLVRNRRTSDVSHVTSFHLVHLLQTVVSDFQSVDDLPFNLSELQVLNLQRARSRVGRGCEEEAEEGGGVHLRVTHQPLQVTDLGLGPVQQLVLVAFLLEQQQRLPVEQKVR